MILKHNQILKFMSVCLSVCSGSPEQLSIAKRKKKLIKFNINISGISTHIFYANGYVISLYDINFNIVYL